MKSLICIMFVFVSFSANAYEMCLIPKQTTTMQARGCCSWHGGVCGCSNGRAKCCDGTLSPSCGC